MTLDWAAFLRLSGSPDVNFERFVYDLVRRHHAEDGRLTYPTNAAGIEFFITLDRGCELGDRGDAVAWQCKWYYPNGRLNSARKRDIQDSFKKSLVRDPSPVRWILCTPLGLTDGEEGWLQDAVPGWVQGVNDELAAQAAAQGLPDPPPLIAPRVDHAFEADFTASMSPPHEFVRSAWFGESVLDEEWLRRHANQATAPLGRKYVPEVHVQTEVEDLIRLAAADPMSWAAALATIDHLDGTLRRRAPRGQEYRALRKASGVPWSADDEVVLAAVDRLSERGMLLLQVAEEARRLLSAGLLDLAAGQLPEVRSLAAAGDREHDDAITRLAGANEELAAVLEPWARDEWTDSEEVEGVGRELVEVLTSTTLPIIAVVGKAGRGKSHLAASAVHGFGESPLGVLIHGVDLARRFSLDDLATSAGMTAMGFEQLVAALDAAGQCAGRRALLVIDALNESEEPTDWLRRLPQIEAILRRYPHVLGLVTVRPSYASEVLGTDPPPRLMLRGFGARQRDAIDRYFKHYKVRLTPGSRIATAPFQDNPILLRIFCEVTNPRRYEEVSVTLEEVSLDGLFDTLVEQAEERVASARGEDPRAGLFRRSLRSIAKRLWDQSVRSIPLLEAKEACGDAPEAWVKSRLRDILAEDLLIHRDNVGGRDAVHFTLDRFAGYAIAEALLAEAAGRGIDVAHDPVVSQKLCGGDAGDLHPLREDILQALAYLMAGIGKPLSEVEDVPCLRQAGLRALPDLPADMTPASAPGAFRDWWYGTTTSRERQGIIGLLMRAPLRPGHPLNVTFIDELLRGLSMPARDLAWSEFVRAHAPELLAETIDLEAIARAGTLRPDEAELVVTWLSWLLTTTVRDLRDHVTRALYSVGRRHPRLIHDAVVASSDIDDPYIRERLLAAAYGIAMARWFDADSAYLDELRTLAAALVHTMVGPDATAPTTHDLARGYATGTLALAKRAGVIVNPPATTSHTTVWGRLAGDDLGSDDVDGVLHMDFKNYTVGRLVEGRGNYDMTHETYVEVLSAIRWRIRDLGYRAAEFLEIDRAIANSNWGDRREGRVDRYGKKYSWIAFHEMSGRLEDEGRLPERSRWDGHGPDATIDPSFPEPTRPRGIAAPNWLGTHETTDPDWLRYGAITVPDDLLLREAIDGNEGPWVLGWAQITISQQDDGGRRVFLLAPAASVPGHRVQDVGDELLALPYPSRHSFPEPTPHYYVYAGEIPWSDYFADPDDDDEPRRDALGDGVASSYDWEDYHSVVNRAGGAVVPRRAFANTTRLDGRAQEFDLFDEAGVRASISCQPDPPWEGQMLYVRGDLMAQYLAERDCRLVWIAWGEREFINPAIGSIPDEHVDIYRSHANVYRRVAYLDVEAWRVVDIMPTPGYELPDLGAATVPTLPELPPDVVSRIQEILGGSHAADWDEGRGPSSTADESQTPR